jgi:hypothetical protein
VAKATPERGRFRAFLLASLRNFLANEWRRGQAAKRGGGQEAVPLDADHSEERFAREPADPGLSPEEAFDRSYAADIIARAIETLRADYQRGGRGALFASLLPLVWGGGRPDSVPEQAGRHGMNAHAFTMALHRLRRRLGECLREEVRQTVPDDADVDSELRHLIVASGGPAAEG